VAVVSVAPAGPEATVAVTTVPLWLTALLLASCSCTTGCGARAIPLCALLEGAVVSASFAATPALRVIVPEGTLVSPEAPKLSV
jgi:hypothetical protein